MMSVASPPNPPTSTRLSVLGRIRFRLAERGRFASTGSWLWTLYDRALARPALRRLPGYRAIRGLRLKGLARPVYIRLGTTDFDVVREIFFWGEYDQLRALPRDGVRTVVDLGANVGLSMRLWREWFPSAMVVGVEPDAENLRVAAMNAGEGQVCLVRACAVGRGRMVGLDRRGGEWGFAVSEGEGAAGEQFEGLTMPEILTRAGIGPGVAIDLLKCDIEGAEAELFEHAAEWLGRVGTLIVELHGEYTPERFMAAARAAGGDFEWVVTQKAAALWVVFGRRRGGGS